MPRAAPGWTCPNSRLQSCARCQRKPDSGVVQVKSQKTSPKLCRRTRDFPSQISRSSSDIKGIGSSSPAIGRGIDEFAPIPQEIPQSAIHPVGAEHTCLVGSKPRRSAADTRLWNTNQADGSDLLQSYGVTTLWNGHRPTASGTKSLAASEPKNSSMSAWQPSRSNLLLIGTSPMSATLSTVDGAALSTRL